MTGKHDKSDLGIRVKPLEWHSDHENDRHYGGWPLSVVACWDYYVYKGVDGYLVERCGLPILDDSGKPQKHIDADCAMSAAQKMHNEVIRSALDITNGD